MAPFQKRSVQDRANSLLDQHRARINAVDVTIAVIITVGRVEAVAPAHIVGDLVIAPERPIAVREALPDVVQLLGLPRRHAGNSFLSEPGRTPANTITHGSSAIVVSVPITRLCD